MPNILMRRIAAFLVDRALILILGLSPVWIAEGYVRIQSRVDPTSSIPLAIPFLLGFYGFYLVILEPLWNGFTPGKLAFGIRVISPNRWRLFLRNLLRMIDGMLIYIPGLILGNRRLGDLISGTKIQFQREIPSRSQLIHAILMGAFFSLIPGYLGYLPLMVQQDHALIAELPEFKGIALCEIPKDGAKLDGIMQSISNAGFDLVRISCTGDTTFDPEVLDEVITEAREHGLRLMVLVGGHWFNRYDRDWVQHQIPRIKHSPSIAYWNLGNEEYTQALGIPRDQIRDLSSQLREMDPGRPQIFSNHMLLQSPDLGGITGGILGPVSTGDLIGFNSYNPGLALSWKWMVELWWEKQTQVDPLTRFILGIPLRMYFWAGDRIPDWIMRSNLGYGYLLHSYALYSKFQGKPWAITEWGGSSDLDVVRAQWELISKFNLTGNVFWEWRNIDYDSDGDVDNHELYEFLSGIG